MRCRFVTTLGKVSTELCEVIAPADRKGVVTLKDEVGSIIRINKDRLLPHDCEDKAVATKINERLIGICPKCLRQLPIAEGRIECPEHGVFDVVMQGSGQDVHSTASQENRNQEIKEPSMANESTGPVAIDLNQVAQYGQLMVKKSLNFDHPTVNVQAHVLIIADDPARKLCFNTYDGALSRTSRDPIVELQLEQFKANQPGVAGKLQGKQVGYLLKKSVDQVMAELEKSGFEKYQPC